MLGFHKFYHLISTMCFFVVAAAGGCKCFSSCVTGAGVGLPFGHVKWYVTFGFSGMLWCFFVAAACVFCRWICRWMCRLVDFELCAYQ